MAFVEPSTRTSLGIVVWSFCISVAVMIALGLSVPELNAVEEFYAANLRGSFFTGFLSLGGFLLALKTFVVIKMKENLYDHPRYKERVINRRRRDPSCMAYGPLCRLGTFLFFAVAACLLTAVLQLTLGLVNHWIPAFICILFALFSIILLFVCLWNVKMNLRDWFDFLEEDSQGWKDDEKTDASSREGSTDQ